jgi:ChrR Cupin-like domain
VLAGVFSDEHGDFGPGMYVRNPPGSRHTPRSAPGCTILVKLRQMVPDDQEYVRIDTTAAPWQQGPVEEVSVMPLFARGSEKVALWRLAPGARLDRHEHPSCWTACSRTSSAATPRAPGCAIRPAAGTSRPARTAACCRSRPVTSAASRGRWTWRRPARGHYHRGTKETAMAWTVLLGRSVGDRLDHRAEAYGRRDRHASQPEVRAASRLFGIKYDLTGRRREATAQHPTRRTDAAASPRSEWLARVRAVTSARRRHLRSGGRVHQKEAKSHA